MKPHTKSSLTTLLTLLGVWSYSTFMNIIWLKLQNFMFERDSYGYIVYAESFANSTPVPEHLISGTKPPLLIWLMAAIIKCGGTAEAGGMAISQISSILTLTAVYFLAKLIFKSNFYAGIAVWLCASIPGFIALGANILRDPLYWMLGMWCITASCYALWGAENKWRSACWGALAGTTMGMAFFCRWEAVELPLFMMLATATKIIVDGKEKMERVLYFGSAACLLFFLILLAGIMMPDNEYFSWRIFDFKIIESMREAK